MMRIDYAPEFSQVKHLDLDELARKHAQDWGVSCEWIVGVPGFLGGGNKTTFAAEGYERCPGFEDFDYLRSYSPIAHRHGIRVISYLNMHWYPYDFGDQHPEWEQIDASGERYGRITPLYGNGTTFCVNTGWRDWAIGLIKEAMRTGIDGVFLDGPLILPDCCYCESCENLFRAATGDDIPLEDWKNPLWRALVKFREDSMAGFLHDVQEAVNEVNPDGVIFMNSGSWDPQGWRSARDIQKLSPFQTFNGAEAFYYYEKDPNIYASLMTGKYLRSGGNPAVVFTHYMNGGWHYSLLPPEELNLALIQTASAGASPWIAVIGSALESQSADSPAFSDMFRFIGENSEYYTNLESIAEVGILFSSRTCRNYLSVFEDIYERPETKEANLVLSQTRTAVEDWAARKTQCEQLIAKAYRGYFSAITRAHRLFDILLDQDLTVEKLSKYKVLVLPDFACLDTESVRVLRDYVAGGGNLLASFEAGFYDGDGSFTDSLFDLLGVDRVEGIFPVTMGENYLQTAHEHLGFERDVLIERGAYALKLRAAEDIETPAFFLGPSDGAYLPLKPVTQHPGIITHQYGKGRVIYFPEMLGHFVGDIGMNSAEMRISRAVETLVGESVLQIDAPRTVSAEIYHQEEQNRLIIHLVNNTVDGRPVGQFLPVHDLLLSLLVPGRPQKVYALRENNRIDMYMIGERCSIPIPKLHKYEVIVLEYDA